MLVKRKSEYPLHIAFIWHMHQPWYLNSGNSTDGSNSTNGGNITFSQKNKGHSLNKDNSLNKRHSLHNVHSFNNVAFLPWVRLHSIKDYLDMVTILDNYPNIKQTFNLVPSLVKQIELISDEKISDKYLDITLKPASKLTIKEKEFILRWMCPPSNIKRISNYKKYKRILIKIEDLKNNTNAGDLKRNPEGSFFITNKLTEQEYRDLQVWFDLSWFDSTLIENNKYLNGLVQKCYGYSEKDKKNLYDEQLKIIKRIIPKYKQMEEQERIEIISSPYYHPILPLLIDNKVAIEANSGSIIPDKHFAFLEDAKIQIEKGLNFHESIFGSRPDGIWSPEMAVSNESLKILSKYGILWTVADQSTLSKSINVDLSLQNDILIKNPNLLYKPYTFFNGNNSINIIFRDQILSDLIGFAYNGMNMKEAVNDFMDRIERIYFSVSRGFKPYLVTVALDGENCWEYYEKDGIEFLSNLYKRLNESNQFKLVGVTDYLRKYPPIDKLYDIKAGSWVRGDFSNWIGGEGQNQAWDNLYQARVDVEKFINSRIVGEKREKILKQIYIAEGSDWFWWIGDNEKSGMDELWEQKFREHLIKIYEILEISPPENLKSPIKIV